MKATVDVLSKEFKVLVCNNRAQRVDAFIREPDCVERTIYDSNHGNRIIEHCHHGRIGRSDNQADFDYLIGLARNLYSRADLDAEILQ